MQVGSAIGPGMSRVADALGIFGFTIILVLTTLPPYLFATIGLCVVSRIPAMRVSLNRLTYRFLNVYWWLTVKLAWWVRVRFDGLDEFQRGIDKSAGKPRCILLNHVSFLDSFLMLGCMPFREIASMKTMAAGHLFKTPVIGTICRACGHLMVPFKSSGDNDFSVDKEAVAEVQQKFEEHVAAGNVGGWFPEGKLHTGDVTKLNTFRAGGFMLPAKIDCEIWCIAHVGNNACWSLKGLGGRPCNITVRFFRLCESSEALADSMPAPKADEDPLRARALFLAQRAQEAIQLAVDGIVAEGWATIPVFSEDKKGK